MRAWVIRWEWAGDHAAVEQPIAAILPWQTGVKQVSRIVEALYAAREYMPDEMLAAATPKGFNPYRAQLGTVTVREGGVEYQVPWTGQVTCRHNPFLHARQATAKARLDGSGAVDYEDLPRPEVVDLDSARDG